jgi:hypothetical protein
VRPEDITSGRANFNLTQNNLRQSARGYAVLFNTLNAVVRAWIATTGYDFNSGNAYAARAVFASYTPGGGGPAQPNYACIVRFKLEERQAPEGYSLFFAVIDQNNTQWQSGQLSRDVGSALTGVFAFPVTFTEYTPTIILGSSWC